MAGSGTAHLRPEADPLLRVDRLHVDFPIRGGRGHRREVVRAVTDVSFDVVKGETLGIVGESGCGKSTTGRAIMQLPPPTSGTVTFDGTDLTALKGEALRALRPKLQLIFQDPISSLNPRRRVGDIVGEPLRIWGRSGEGEGGPAKWRSDAGRNDVVDEVLEAVGLDPAIARAKRPHEFSGGQCQRISIARSLVLDPQLLICDEPVSALDVSVQAQILNLLEDLKVRYGLTLVFIAHDLAVVKHVSDRVAVMYLGKLCEVGAPDVLYHRPAHPYTEALLSSIPAPDPSVAERERIRLAGDPPSPVDPPSGCRFRTRCPRADEQCTVEEPLLRPVLGTSPDGGQVVACHHPLVDAGPVPIAIGAAAAGG